VPPHCASRANADSAFVQKAAANRYSLAGSLLVSVGAIANPKTEYRLMQIDIYPPLPAFMLERLVPFEHPHNGKHWGDLYAAVRALHEAYPQQAFVGQPYLYVDLAGQSCGFLFVERDSDDLYYVHA